MHNLSNNKESYTKTINRAQIYTHICYISLQFDLVSRYSALCHKKCITNPSQHGRKGLKIIIQFPILTYSSLERWY